MFESRGMSKQSAHAVLTKLCWQVLALYLSLLEHR